MLLCSIVTRGCLNDVVPVMVAHVIVAKMISHDQMIAQMMTME